MKIGIDISQIAYEGTGVAKYTRKLVENLLKIDKENIYILFASSLRRRSAFDYYRTTVLGNSILKVFPFPATLLDLLWNRLHVLPIEWLIGDVDVFITSDWTEPPTVKAKKITILHDLVVYKPWLRRKHGLVAASDSAASKFPKETDKKIVETQKRKLEWVKKESAMVVCVSESTKNDAQQILGIEGKRLRVIYEGGGETC